MVCQLEQSWAHPPMTVTWHSIAVQLDIYIYPEPFSFGQIVCQQYFTYQRKDPKIVREKFKLPFQREGCEIQGRGSITVQLKIYYNSHTGNHPQFQAANSAWKHHPVSNVITFTILGSSYGLCVWQLKHCQVCSWHAGRPNPRSINAEAKNKNS